MDEPPILSSAQTGVVEEQEGCSVCVYVCVYTSAAIKTKEAALGLAQGGGE